MENRASCLVLVIVGISTRSLQTTGMFSSPKHEKSLKRVFIFNLPKAHWRTRPKDWVGQTKTVRKTSGENSPSGLLYSALTCFLFGALRYVGLQWSCVAVPCQVVRVTYASGAGYICQWCGLHVLVVPYVSWWCTTCQCGTQETAADTCSCAVGVPWVWGTFEL